MSALAFNPNGARLPSTPTRASLKRSFTMPVPSTPSSPAKKRKTAVDEFDSEGNKENIAPPYLGLITPTKGPRHLSSRKSTGSRKLKSSPSSRRSSSSVAPSTPSTLTPSRRSTFTFSPTSLADKLAEAAALDSFEFEFDFGVKSAAEDCTPPASP